MLPESLTQTTFTFRIIMLTVCGTHLKENHFFKMKRDVYRDGKVYEAAYIYTPSLVPRPLPVEEKRPGHHC